MRERVALWGGALAVGPVSGGGYRVLATLPFGDTRVTVRVVVADDQVLVRSGFTVLLAGEPDIEVVGEAGNGAEALALVASERPDVVLMDVRMPVMDGLEATRQITEDPSLADTKVVILTTFDLDEYVHEALRAGASGFLLKDTLPDDLHQRRAGRRRRRRAARAEDHAPSHRGVRRAARAGRRADADGAARPAHRARAGGARDRGAGASPTPRSPRSCS